MYVDDNSSADCMLNVAVLYIMKACAAIARQEGRCLIGRLRCRDYRSSVIDLMGLLLSTYMYISTISVLMCVQSF